jgi:hypothetical protein
MGIDGVQFCGQAGERFFIIIIRLCSLTYRW